MSPIDWKKERKALVSNILIPLVAFAIVSGIVLAQAVIPGLLALYGAPG